MVIRTSGSLSKLPILTKILKCLKFWMKNQVMMRIVVVRENTNFHGHISYLSRRGMSPLILQIFLLEGKFWQFTQEPLPYTKRQ
nr:hypothetical protein Iba_chr11bCG2180 [Ipomoea batatas]